ncbi:uncharacterized protein BX664DRAFT_340245 [Halteromyces radiatus]|uniref:uncharacterized protein n=1 Tax=Halteromyces radiatus TaxID=101107 RepID=UPI00221E7D1C|nr:uncharacterized protein BX664DRAFT_340245 [Halteromyces radiatus]KAI8081380.1 hypothetical protein BX664DRAFT_340245 [Halteromyces radiatus]
MRHRGKNTKTIDIRLHEEKFYFPGETIKGAVTIHPKSPTKTNHIVIRFSGQVFISVKDKEVINLFSKTKILPISTIEDTKSSHVLDAKQHSFPFEFVVPDDLPSTMEFGKRKARVKYILTAIHDRPMVPESLCAKVSYTVPILELIDVTKTPFINSQEKSMDILLPGAKYNKKCQTTASMPRFGYTRGEIVPLKIVINHFEAFSLQNALEVELVRTVEIRTQKNTASTEDILKVVKQDIKIIGPYNFSQSTTCQLMIPTSTPPTIRFKDKTLHIHYKVRVRVKLSSTKKSVSSLEMPFVVGTWPRADIPIDDDDDDELIELLGETMLSDDDDDDDDNSNPGNNDLDRKDTNHSSTHHNRYSIMSASSATTLALQKNDRVGRSDSTQSRVSHRSIGSISSWRSSQSLENNNLSRNTSTSMTPIDQQQHQMYQGFGRSSTSNDIVYSSQNALNRSSSTPDLLANPTTYHHGHYTGPGHLQHQNTYPFQDNRQQTYYDDGMHRVPYYQQNISPYATSSQQQHIPYSNNNNNLERGSISPSSYTAYQHNRMGSEEYRSMGYSAPLQPNQTMIDDVPTRVLQPMPSTSTPATPAINRFRTTQKQQDNNNSTRRNYDYSYYDDLTDSEEDKKRISSTTVIPAITTVSDDDDDDDSDDGDLFVIIERKKKQAEREMRQKQRTMYTVAE